MTRRTALQFVAAMFTLAKGERIMADQKTSGTVQLSDFKPTSIRFHIDPAIKLEVQIGGEVIEIPQAELLAALKGSRS
jgi:hypothetical protein